MILKTTTFAILATIAVMAAVASVFVATPAEAAITPPNCTNPGGNQPGGQQPTCTGSGQTQNPAKNPAGNEPPGQQ